MTSDDDRTPPLLDDDEDGDIDEEDTEDEEEEEQDDVEFTAGNNNNLILQQEDETAHHEVRDPTGSLNSDPTTSVTIADQLPESALKRPRIVDDEEPEQPIRVATVSLSSTGDDQARKLFQRLWTDEDEIGLLQGFLDYSTQRGTSQNNPHETALFYDQIKSKLQLDFNKNQLVEKLRRLKKKYRNVLARISSGKEISFKSPHDQATFEIATKIWGTAHKPTSSNKDHHLQHHQYHHQQQQQMLQRRIDVDDDMPPNFNPTNTNLNLNFASHFSSSYGSDRVADERKSQHKSSKKQIREKNKDARLLMDCMGGSGDVPAGSSRVQIPIWPPRIGLSTPVMTEEKTKNKISPTFNDMYKRSGGSGGFVDGIVSPVPLSFASPSVTIFGGMEVADGRWRKQQILELEVYSKRLELVQEQIKLTLEQLHSKGADC